MRATVLNLVVVTFFLAAALDVTSTFYGACTTKGQELNPIFAPFVACEHSFYMLMWTGKILAFLFIIVVSHLALKWQMLNERWYHILLITSFIAGTLVWSAAALYNLTNMGLLKWSP